MMSEEEKRIQELVGKLDLLFEQQSAFHQQIQALQQQLYRIEQQGPSRPRPKNTLDPEPNLQELPTGDGAQDAFAQKINGLRAQITDLSAQQTSFKQRIHAIRKEIYLLEEEVAQKAKAKNTLDPQPTDLAETIEQVVKEKETTQTNTLDKKPTDLAEEMAMFGQDAKAEQKARSAKRQSDLEKFLGENLISKIGIGITVIGVGIGGKYAIDHDMINPLTRIILGYLMGLGLLGTGLYLKKKYENYSAVLLSGGMAIMYFITFFAYSLYDLMPQTAAFGLMLVFTVFTVVAALNYSQQVIGIIGLVGAYGIPFLLSDGSGRVGILFSYMGIINIGILAIAVHRYWKLLYYIAFSLTWLVFLGWYGQMYDVEASNHLSFAIGFSLLFFLIFYATFIAYKLLHKEKFELLDIVMVMGNTFIYYGVNYAVMSHTEHLDKYLGLFTIGNALVHLGVSQIVKRMRLADKNLFYLIGGLMLTFITIAIPVQLDGNWVTLLWVGEALLLFWIGREKQIAIYEKLSYPLMLLSFVSLAQDWGEVYNYYDKADIVTPILNIQFLSSLLFVAAFAAINWLKKTRKAVAEMYTPLYAVIRLAIPSILLLALFFTFSLEIGNYWEGRYLNSEVEQAIDGLNQFSSTVKDPDLRLFKVVWLMNYGLVFMALLAIVNIRVLKDRQLALVNLGVSMFVLLSFLTGGLHNISELRESYINQEMVNYFVRGGMHLGIRYISLACVALLLLTCFAYTKQAFLKANLKRVFEFVFHASILWVASSELIHWLEVAESAQSDKLGLSILWGLYSLLLIALGIWKRKAHLRFAAMGLFGVTLLKLFFYDLSELTTLAKTIVLVCLGILLLIISFLYNKFKSQIAGDDEA